MRRLMLCALLCGPACAIRSAPAEPEQPCAADTPLVAGAAGSPGHLIKSALHPEGASELATLMRLMESDLKAARASLDRGEAVAALYPRHRRIRCSWPTSPSDRAGAFDSFAVGYLERVRAFDGSAEKSGAYPEVVGGCRACHEQSCPGPLAAIDALAR